MKVNDSLNIVKLVAAVLVALLLLAIHFLNPSFFPELMHVLAQGDMRETAAYIDSFGDWAIFFSFWLTLFVNAIGFPPAIIFSTANSIIFGLPLGIFISLVAETVGVIISFLLLRFLFRSSAEKIIAKSSTLQSIDKYSGRQGFTLMLIARMVPYLPSALLNALGALSKISLRDYAVASFVGKFPSTSIEAIIGHDTIMQQESHARLAVACVLAVLLIAGAWWHERRGKGKRP